MSEENEIMFESEDPQGDEDQSDKAYDAMKDEEAGIYFEKMKQMFDNMDIEFLTHLYDQEYKDCIPKSMMLIVLRRYLDDKLQEKCDKACLSSKEESHTGKLSQ